MLITRLRLPNERLVTSSPQYGYRYLIKGKEVVSSPQYGYRYLTKDWCHLTILFYFIVSVSVTCYSIIIEATE